MKQRLLNPGPANTSDRVKQAQVIDDICPREKEFGHIMYYVKDNLTYIGLNGRKNMNYDTVLFGSSGTGACESVISSLPSQSKLLVIINGAYGERALKIAKRHNIDVTSMNFGSVLNYEAIETELSLKYYDYVYVIHSETTSGALNDIERIGKYCKKSKSSLIVDAMSSFGAYEIDVEKHNVDFLIASSNKNLQGMAGIGFVICKVDELKKLKDCARTYYFDIYDQWEYFYKSDYQLRFTPPVQTIYALKEAIEETLEETVKLRHKRYKENCEVLRKGMKDLGMKQYIDDENSSIIITSFDKINHPNYNFDEMHDFLKNKGFTIYPGKVSNAQMFRLSNIGTLTIKDIKDFLIVFKEYLDFLETF